ncbi:uncharacterized protein LOC135496622 [Lineus longissimus]|uniref:uncharacterized protein LOC135496622 n=1 Tax=Lineus longissimus TaxID=88925 RepID=UPI00315CD040
MADFEKLQQETRSQIEKLRQSQSRCRHMVEKVKEKENVQGRGSKRHLEDDDERAAKVKRRSCEDQVTASVILPSSANARKQLKRRSRSRSGLRLRELNASLKKYSPVLGVKNKKTFTSTPVGTPQKVKKVGNHTPKSILKRRQLIERNVKVKSKLRDTSLAASPNMNESKSLNFSYSTTGSPSQVTSHRYNTRHSSTARSHDRSGGIQDVSTAEELMDDPGNQRRPLVHKRDSTKRSILCEPLTRKPANRVTFNESLSRTYSNLYDEDNPQGRPPLLGYDWIAGNLDNDQSVVNKPDEYFEELRQFRQTNKQDCVSKPEFPARKLSDSNGPASPDVQDPSHTCIHTYVVDKRLFTVPINKRDDGSSYCPICRKPRSEPTAADPGFVRISLPKSALRDNDYKVKPHRRRSYDPSDSCALSEHCLAGWQSAKPATIKAASNMDLMYASKGIKGQLATTQSEVEKIVREQKDAYHIPEPLKKSQLQVYELRERRANLANPMKSRREKTDELLKTSHALRHHLQVLDRKQNPSELAANSTQYPVL